MEKSIFIGSSKFNFNTASIKGELVLLNGENFYKIFNYHQMLPFFMSIVSDSNHWMFISSKGGLTAGRKNPDFPIFPYVTDDKIHDASENTGSKTILFVVDV